VSEESPKAIVALRVVRPYDSEEQFLKEESFAVTRTSLVLVGASSRPEGVILRFEVVLRTGAILLRGEGRVIAHGPTPLGENGLTLKFTRLDPRSKALVDRAGAPKVVDAPRPSEPPPPVRARSHPPAAPSEPKIEEAPLSMPPPAPDPGGHATVPAMRAVRFGQEEAPTSRGDSLVPSSPPPSLAPPAATSVPPPPQTVPPAATEVPPALATLSPSVALSDGLRESALDRLRGRLAGKSPLAVLASLTGKG